MLRGMATVNYWADDLEAAKRWYSELLGVEPYFERPGYAEFRIGDYEHELGLIDARYAPEGHGAGPAGAVLHWHVDDVGAALKRLLSIGAREHQPVTEWGTAGGSSPPRRSTRSGTFSASCTTRTTWTCSAGGSRPSLSGLLMRPSAASSDGPQPGGGHFADRANG